LPGDFEKYERFPASCSAMRTTSPRSRDRLHRERYFDLGGQKQPPRDVAETIRKAIRQSLKIGVSEGIAASKLVSQIASKLRKPACFLEIAAGREREFLDPLENKWLPGVGPKLSDTLTSAGLAIIQQV